MIVALLTCLLGGHSGLTTPEAAGDVLVDRWVDGSEMRARRKGRCGSDAV